METANEAVKAETVTLGVSDCNLLNEYGAEMMRIDFTADPELAKKYGKAIKALGGNYNECRGYAGSRFVTLPICLQSVTLVNAMMADFGPDYKGFAKKADGKYCMVVHSPREVEGVIGTVHQTKDVVTTLATMVQRLKAALASGKVESNAVKAVRLEVERVEAVKRNYEWALKGLAEAAAAMKKEGLIQIEGTRHTVTVEITKA